MKEKTCLERRHLLNGLDKRLKGLSCHKKTAPVVPTSSQALLPGPREQKCPAHIPGGSTGIASSAGEAAKHSWTKAPGQAGQGVQLLTQL